MFNNRRIARPVNPAVLERNDLASLNNIRNKSLEQRIVTRHESYIQSLKNKVSELEKNSGGSDETTDPRVDSLNEQCEIQSNLLKKYEEKLVGMVGYIKRLEEGLEKVKELLTNKTNTADTIDKIPEFDDAEQQTEEVVQEVSQEVAEQQTEEVAEEVSEEASEELTIEKVKEDGDVESSVSLEIIEE
tara:strand:+ start:222 stop:785 length:564 start_codon:yes stop_codon:yes gene_type:complete